MLAHLSYTHSINTSSSVFRQYICTFLEPWKCQISGVILGLFPVFLWFIFTASVLCQYASVWPWMIPEIFIPGREPTTKKNLYTRMMDASAADHKTRSSLCGVSGEFLPLLSVCIRRHFGVFRLIRSFQVPAAGLWWKWWNIIRLIALKFCINNPQRLNSAQFSYSAIMWCKSLALGEISHQLLDGCHDMLKLSTISFYHGNSL